MSDIEEDESFKFVSHSKGAAFSEGMADYLREQGYTVDVMIHLSPFQASDIHSSGEREDVLTIDYQTKGDPVLMLGLFSQGTIGGADAIFRKEPIHGVKEMQYIHTESLSSSVWDEIMNAVNNFLQK